MLIAQITDMHVGLVVETENGTVDTLTRLERAIAHLNALRPRPDLVLATGDLTRDGHLDEYAALRHALSALAIPYALIPGNHDDRENLRATFGDVLNGAGADGFLHQAIEGGELRILCLDTQVPGYEGGALCAARLAWFEARLAEAPARPTLVAMHHPPIDVGMPMFQRWPFEGGPAMAEIVARHPQIEAIVCGHIHRPISRRWHGTVIHVTPATGFQYPLELLEPDADAVDEPSACRLLQWRPESGLLAHLSYIG